MKKWYLSTWFIAILFALWPLYGISIILGFLLLIWQQKVYGSAEQALSHAINEAKSIVDGAREDAKKIVDEANQQKELIINEKDFATKELENIAQEKQFLLQKIYDLNSEIKQLKIELDSLSKTALVAFADVSMYEEFTSEEIKNQLQLLRLRQQDLIKNDNALKITASPEVKKIFENNIKQILRCFNAECENIISNVTARNIDTARNKIIKSFETLNKIFETDGVAISKDYLESKLEELNLIYTFQLKKEQEKEMQKAIREQLLDEEKARKELERERQKLEKEETHFKNEIKKLMAHMQKTTSDIEKSFYIEQIKSIEEKLDEVTKTKEDIINREQNTRAGFVYVISNIGAFGENVYKIGMTRRLDPMDRINELGDASVPFKFDVHAIIFSEDAPTLEATLHERFRKYELNKVNPRKEFFKVPLEVIKKAVEELHSGHISWNFEPLAEEYWESKRRNAM